MAEFREISEEEWEQMPSPTPAKPPNRWDELLGAVASGKIVVIEVPEGKLRGTRIGLARTASSRGLKLAFRAHAHQLAIRRSEQTASAREVGSATTRTRKGRQGAPAGAHPEESSA